MTNKNSSTAELAALAFAAYRINNNQVIKSTHVDAQNHSVIEANQILMLSDIDVTDQDIANAEQALELLQKHQMFKTLQNQKINNFEQTIMNLVVQPQCSLKNTFMMAWLPQVAEQIKQQQLRDQQVNKLNFLESYLGSPGDKITFDFVLIGQKYLEFLSCWSVEGHDSQGHFISFLTRRRDCVDSGRYVGRVKKTEPSKYHNFVATTMVNYVKPVKIG